MREIKLNYFNKRAKMESEKFDIKFEEKMEHFLETIKIKIFIRFYIF